MARDYNTYLVLTTIVLTTVVAYILPFCSSHPQILFSEHNPPVGAFPTTKRTRIIPKKSEEATSPPSASTPKTSVADDNALRASLCPNLAENVSQLFRYDRTTSKCYRGGDRGPCGQNMILFSENESRVYGICDCDSRNYERPLIFHPETNQCYFVYSKGYCSAKKWLIFNNQDRPTCGFNPCFRVQKEAPPGTEYVPFRGKCLKLGSELEECGEGKVITFIRDKLLPTCAVKRSSGITGLTVTVPKFRCAPGSAQSISGRCKATVKFSLN